MPTIQCPHCGRELQYPEMFAGGSIACPSEGGAKAVQLPNLDAAFPIQYAGPGSPTLPMGPRRSEEYYLRKQFDSAVVVGPLARARLQELVREGKVHSDDELSVDRKKWWPAVRVEPELFGRGTAQLLCRTCGAVLSQGT